MQFHNVVFHASVTNWKIYCAEARSRAFFDASSHRLKRQ